MRAPMLGSIALHAVVGVLVFAVARQPGSSGVSTVREPSLIAVEMANVPPHQPTRDPPAPADRFSIASDGGPRSARRTGKAFPGTGLGTPAGPGAGHRERNPYRDVTTRIEQIGARGDNPGPKAGESGKDGGGETRPGENRGDGTGGRGGGGIGFGDGGGLALPASPAPPPPPSAALERPRSKARPARLIYPSRESEVDETTLFVARVVVDDEGFVVGAHLVHGFGGKRDETAEHAVWRFRYAPATDDDGHPIRSTVDQRFAVQ